MVPAPQLNNPGPLGFGWVGLFTLENAQGAVDALVRHPVMFGITDPILKGLACNGNCKNICQVLGIGLWLFQQAAWLAAKGFTFRPTGSIDNVIHRELSSQPAIPA
jgi:hypothetical protein